MLTKLDRVTRHFDQVVDINVLLSVEKLKEKERRQKAEVTLHVKGKDIFVEHAHEDLYAAIDQLMDKLDRQVCRHKDKVQDHHHAAAEAASTRRRPDSAIDSVDQAACGPLFHVVRPAGVGCCRSAASAAITTPHRRLEALHGERRDFHNSSTLS